MELLRETSANMRNGCPLCISPAVTPGLCVGVDLLATFPVTRSFILNLNATLSEPSHVADVLIDQSGVDNFGRPISNIAHIYDKYPLASDIQEKAVLEYQSPCSWVFQDLTYRFYRVTTTSVYPDYDEEVEFTDYTEDELVAPGFTQPYSCSGSPPIGDIGHKDCSSTYYGWRWTFRFEQPAIGATPVAYLLLERFNARHCSQYTSGFSNHPVTGWFEVETTTVYTPFRPGQTGTFIVPSAEIPKTGMTTGLRHQSNTPSDSGLLTQASYPPSNYTIGVTNYPAPTVIAGWKLQLNSMGDNNRPLVLQKYYDASVDSWLQPSNGPLNSPFGFPSQVIIPFGY